MRWRGISTESTPESYLPLAVQLQRIRENTERYVQADKLAIHERAVARLKEQGTVARALKTGDRAPEFALLDQNSREVRSCDLLANGRLIVVFFRGRWCPYCVTQLESLQFLAPDLAEKDASLVAISPQKVHHNFLTADQHKLRFPLLSDRANVVTQQFGIAYKVPQEQADLYRTVFINLAALNDDAPDSLPLPATFVISQQGVIEQAFAEEDFRLRPEPADLLSLL
jgi:peroxiredoxin